MNLEQKPDLIYIDSDKVLNDLDVCKALFQIQFCVVTTGHGVLRKGSLYRKQLTLSANVPAPKVTVKRATWVIHAAKSIGLRR